MSERLRTGLPFCMVMMENLPLLPPWSPRTWISGRKCHAGRTSVRSTGSRVCVWESGQHRRPRHWPSSPLTSRAPYLYRLLHQVHLGLLLGEHLLEDKERAVTERGLAWAKAQICFGFGFVVLIEVQLIYSINFCWTAKWFSYTYTYIHMYTHTFFFLYSFPLWEDFFLYSFSFLYSFPLYTILSHDIFSLWFIKGFFFNMYLFIWLRRVLVEVLGIFNCGT